MAAPVRHARPPVRIAHLGLGAFHRSHQAWYTQHATDADAWGIAAFTGRSPVAADALAAQDGVYSLVTRGPEVDRVESIESIVGAYDGADASRWLATVADPAVALLTVTVSEAGYAPGGSAVQRIAAALAARRAADAGPIAVVSCDNLIGNGAVLRRAVLAVDPQLEPWAQESVSFPDTMVDRITPAATDADRTALRETYGIDDPCLVVAEPFSEWVIAGALPAGHPEWHGVRRVEAIAPYEERKLWLLNAGHSALAAAGPLRGFATVDEAFADPDLRALVEGLWDEQRAVVDLPASELDDAIAALRERFANPRIRHSLAQIGENSGFKVPARILAPMRRRVARGLTVGAAQLAVVDLWLAALDRFGPTDTVAASALDRTHGMDAASRRAFVIDTLTPGDPA